MEKTMDIKQEFREEKNMDVYATNVNDGSFSNIYVKWLEAKLTLTDVSKCNCDGNDDVFEEQYVLQHLINNTWQVVGEKTNTVWKQGKKEDCIKWMDL
tara:strand:+ start:96 stop:389 length:294 start_codon:yes stop_codon:yes gene_type:complete